MHPQDLGNAAADAHEKPALLLICDHAFMRQCLLQHLQQDYQIVQTFTPQGSNKLAKQKSLNLALVALESGRGLVYYPQIAALSQQGVRVMVLGNYHNLQTMRACIMTGVAGWLGPDCEMAELRHSLQQIALGSQCYRSQDLRSAWQEINQVIPNLNSRQFHMLRLLLNKPMPSNEELALALHISQGRIKNCLTDLFTLFRAENRHQLVEHALEPGFFPGIQEEHLPRKLRRAM